MREIEGYPAWDAHVTQPVGVVTWNGQERDVSAVELTRELSSSLPSQVAGAADLVASHGKVTWAPEENADDDLHLPWTDPRMPRRGDTAAVYLGLWDENGARRFNRQITGIIDDTAGSVVSGQVQASVVDHIDRFSVRTDQEPLWYRHPAPTTDAPALAMGLHPTYITDRMARAAKFYATPRLQSDAVLSVPMMGSAWPERGTLRFASGNMADYPTYMATPWGLAVGNIDAQWSPTGTTRLTSAVYQHFLISPPLDSGAVRLVMTFEGGATVTTRFTPSSLVVETATGSAGFVLPTITSEDGAEVSVWFNAGYVRVQVNDVLAAAQPLDGLLAIGDAPLWHVRLFASGAESTGLGGLQIGAASERRDLHLWTRTAIIETVPYGNLRAIPAWVDRTALEVLKEQAEAELAAMWIDEHGRFRYRHRDRLVSGPVAQTITLDNIDDLSWSESWRSVREQVFVSYEKPSARMSPGRRVTAYQGSGESIGRDDSLDQLINVPDEEDWIGVDTNMAILTLTDDSAGWASRKLWNEGRRTFIAGVIDESREEGQAYPEVPASATHMTPVFNKVHDRLYGLTVTINPGSFDPSKQLTLKSAENTSLTPSRRGISTPLIRAFAVVTWGEEVTETSTGGRADTGVLEHNAGRWIQSAADANRLLTYLASWVTNPQPVLNDVPVTPDDRRQLGDIYVLDLGTTPSGVKRPSLRVLCIGIEDTMTADPVSKTQTLTLQVLNVIGA